MNTASVSNIIAIHRDTAQAETMGYMVFWSLSKETPVQALADSWAKHGLASKLLPDAPSPTASFSRACQEFKDPNTQTIVRPVKGGFAMVRERPYSDGTIEHFPMAYAYQAPFRVVPGNAGAPHSVYSQAFLDSDAEGVALRLGERIAHHSAHYAVNDLSVWVTGLVKSQKAVALRPTGGFYFVPPSGVAFIDSMKQALSEVGITLYTVSAVQDEAACEAIVDALSAEALSQVETMSQELSTLGPRALASRERAAKDLEAKVSSYETLLSRRLDAVGEKLSALRHGIVVAMAQAEDDANATP